MCVKTSVSLNGCYFFCTFIQKRISPAILSRLIRISDLNYNRIRSGEKPLQCRKEKQCQKKQFGKRLLQILIVLIGVSFFTFGLTYLSPGDPAEIMLTECGNLPTPELLEQTRHELGLDQPFLVQYGSWVKGVLTGDMGTSYAFKVPVTEKLMKCFWPTLQMSLFALLLMILFSIPCGILSAVYQNKWPDYLIRGITFFGLSIPSFWIGLILLSIFGVQLRWINVAGGTTDFKAMILPSVTLALMECRKCKLFISHPVIKPRK